VTRLFGTRFSSLSITLAITGSKRWRDEGARLSAVRVDGGVRLRSWHPSNSTISSVAGHAQNCWHSRRRTETRTTHTDRRAFREAHKASDTFALGQHLAVEKHADILDRSGVAQGLDRSQGCFEVRLVPSTFLPWPLTNLEIGIICWILRATTSPFRFPFVF
jgi:hypothetical protein